MPREYHRLAFLVDENNENVKAQERISFEAGDIVGKLYDELLKQYADPSSEETLKSLNKLCVRIVFCLYAEDAGLFASKNQFHDYLKRFEKYPSQVRKNLIELFEVLNTPIESRDKYLEEDLAKFPYVNGGLFADTKIEIPNFNDEIVHIILREGSQNFDWSEISPTIFGSLFESTLNPVTRSQGGMHYTSVQNIHKVIDPLFLDDLKAELDDICTSSKSSSWKTKALGKYQAKLASLRFLDPACGSGNFLTETYLCLRRLENKVLTILSNGQMTMGDIANPIKVNIEQFYGIEINDFAVSVAQTALWIAESQMRQETAEIVYLTDDYLPLKSINHIVEANACIVDWEQIVPVSELSYIIGNPPFVGARLKGGGKKNIGSNKPNQQKKDLETVFGKDWHNLGNLDYVSAWFMKSLRMMLSNNKIRSSLVATNSICQGVSIGALWKPLMKMGLSIDYAYRTFRWDNNAKDEAKVHCVIVAFSVNNPMSVKRIYDNDKVIVADNINAYLLDMPNYFVESVPKALVLSPSLGIGNKPVDGGHYLFSKEQMEAFVAKEPQSKPYFKRWYGAKEFINRIEKYCLWLGDCLPSELVKMPECLNLVNTVREWRLQHGADAKKLADTPTRFHVENMPKGNYVLIPCHSSEKRKYIPMDYVDSDTLSSNATLLVTNATLYHFGILTSSLHMIWMKNVGGKIKSDYRYSKEIVYNNFPWTNATEEQKAKIEKTAQKILDARKLYQDCSYAELYDEKKMILFTELRKAHIENDNAVMELYGFDTNMNEEQILLNLFELHKKLTDK